MQGLTLLALDISPLGRIWIFTKEDTGVLVAMSSIQPLGREVTAGAVFGAALYSAGVYHPSVIQSQLRFESFQMLQVMLGASAASA